MKIVYSLPHPADTLGSEKAGHAVRARSMLAALESLGNEIVVVEAASNRKSEAVVHTYRDLVKRWVPPALAMRMRDIGRVAYGRVHADRLLQAIDRHRPDVILETHIAFSVAGATASVRSGVPLILDDVAPSWEEERQYGVGNLRLAVDVHRHVTRHARLLVAVSDTIYNLLVEDGLPASKIVTISNGIDCNLFHASVDGTAIRMRCGIPPDTVTFVFVGSFQSYHRVDLLIDAFAQICLQRPLHLLLVGEGKQTPACREQVARLGIERQVTFTGRVNYSQVAAYMAAGDVAVMPASNDYGNPMKIYEYMALGKAVVAPDQPTITEIATHRTNAWLFPPENIAELTRALTLLVQNRPLRDQLGQAAGELAAGHTWLRKAVSLQDAMLDVLA